VVLSIIDFRIYEIPIEINVFLLIIAILRLGLDFRHWSSHIIGFFAVSLFLYIIFLLSQGRAIGGGDIKLMAVGGLFLGWQGILIAFILGCILGSVFHLIRMKVNHAKRLLALGPYLSIGMLMSMLYGDKIWFWYLGGY
jgi:leader peptidase (prepilin peptidase)/N-methyltransferase